MNVFDDLEQDFDGPGGRRWRETLVADKLGARLGGASLYELEPGQTSWPYHYHYGNEEWILVLAGRPTVRTPDGDHELRPGDVGCFPTGPAGAHAIRNEGDEPARYVLFSTRVSPGVVVYPDSDKIGARPGDGGPDSLNFPRSAAVEYWEGER